MALLTSLGLARLELFIILFDRQKFNAIDSVLPAVVVDLDATECESANGKIIS